MRAAGSSRRTFRALPQLFEFQVRPRILCGPHKVREVGFEMQKLHGTSADIVTDPVLRQPGLVQRVVDDLAGSGVTLAGIFDAFQEDFTERDKCYDLILNAVSKAQLSCLQALTPNGKHVTVDHGSPKMQAEGLLFLNQVIEAGKMKPVIDRCYPLDQIVEAHRYVDLGPKNRDVVITVARAGE